MKYLTGLMEKVAKLILDKSIQINIYDTINDISENLFMYALLWSQTHINSIIFSVYLILKIIPYFPTLYPNTIILGLYTLMSDRFSEVDNDSSAKLIRFFV